MGITIKQTRSVTIPPGWYRGIVMGITEVEGEYGPQLEWTFMLDGFEDKLIRAWTSTIFSPQSKLFSWVEAVFAKTIPPSYDLDTDHLLGKAVDVRLEERPGRAGTFVKVTQLAAAGSMSARSEETDLPF